MFAFIPEFGIIALGMTLLLTAGIFDLSVGSVFGFVPLVMYTLVNTAGVAPELALVAASDSRSSSGSPTASSSRRSASPHSS